jgi:hypothetical protein
MSFSRSLSLFPLTIVAIACLAMFLTSAGYAHAQVGQNAICGTPLPTGITCSKFTSGTAGVLDASMYTGTDLCAKLNSAINALPTGGAVIDARGVTVSFACGSSPWNGISSPNPAVILLPAGTITIPSTWVLPNYTRIYGEGQRGAPGSSGTVIQAQSSFSVGTAMIQFGALTGSSCTTAPLFGISIQDVMLDGMGQNIVGILNECSQELTYVDRVNLFDIAGTGLEVTGNQAQNSGPYSNIACNPGTAGSGSNISSATTCVSLNGTGTTRGVHGLTATVGSHGVTCPGTSCPAAAVYLDTNNTSLEDLHFEGFVDGVLVGSKNVARNNVIFSVQGGGSSLTGGTSNVVEISSNQTSGNANVSDLSIMGVSWSSNPASSTNAILDDLTGSTLAEKNVGLYALGEPLGGGSTGSLGYSRFTTSVTSTNTNSTPTWGSGALGSGTHPSTPCVDGSLFSNTTGGAGATLWACVAAAWKDIE